MAELVENSLSLPCINEVDFEQFKVEIVNTEVGFVEFKMLINGLVKTIGYTKRDVYKMVLDTL